MKNVKILQFSLLLLASLFVNSELFAQPSFSLCGTYDIVAESCVGACGNPGELSYEVTPPCPAITVPMCLNNIGSNLCPSHRAIAKIKVNGQLVASGDITVVGSSISFSAPCGAVVKVVVHAFDVVPGIECIQLGELKFALRRG